MNPEELSRQLRRGSSRCLKHRRGVVGLSLAAIGSLGVVSLYQMGMIERVPEPPLPLLDADEVDAAPEAYEVLEMPDAVLGIASYALTAALAAAGGEDRAKERPGSPWRSRPRSRSTRPRPASSPWSSGRRTGRSACGAWPPPVRASPPPHWWCRRPASSSPGFCLPGVE